MRRIVTVLFLLVAVPVCAAPNVVVQAIQMPAWLQRGATTRPLSVGMVIRDDDKLITGTDARVLLRSADGSAIKLGEQATLTLSGLEQRRGNNSLFRALLDVAKGAFRFTTAAVARLRPRDVTVRVAGATVGIRGTDVWGKVGGKMSVAAMEKAMGKSLSDINKEGRFDFDVVCLIEGKISVTPGSAAPFVMDQPQTFYVMRKDAPPLPVASLASEQLAKWAAETEIAKGQGASRAGGKWKVTLLTANNQRDALAAYDQLRSAGYDARIRPLPDGEFLLHITQLPSRAEAQALAHKLTGKMGITSPTVGR
ncbi:MAG: FecR domain-containing protein [Gallionella sp.]